MTRADWLLLLFVVGGLPLLYLRFWFHGGEAGYLQVREADRPARTVSLDRDRVLELGGPLGNSRIEVRDGRARFLESSCTGKHCIRMGWLSTSGEMAACLPNRVSIQLLGRHPRFDAINF
jgi:hypothetical protein